MIPQTTPLFAAVVETAHGGPFVALVVGWVRDLDSGPDSPEPRFWPVLAPLDQSCTAADTVARDDRAAVRFCTSRKEAEHVLAATEGTR